MKKIKELNLNHNLYIAMKELTLQHVASKECAEYPERFKDEFNTEKGFMLAVETIFSLYPELGQHLLQEGVPMLPVSKKSSAVVSPLKFDLDKFDALEQAVLKAEKLIKASRGTK